MKRIILIIAIGALMLSSNSVYALPIQVFGSGSAVTSVDAFANFEEMSSRGTPDNPIDTEYYEEGGMLFRRMGDYLTDNLNIGYYNSDYISPEDAELINGFYDDRYYSWGFEGNVFNVDGYNGHIQLQAPTGELFYGLEFLTGAIAQSTWDSSTDTINFYWMTYKDGEFTEGLGTHQPGTVMGFIDPDGFEAIMLWQSASELIIDVGGTPFHSFASMDNVRAQFSPTPTDPNTPVPEPATMLLLGTGLVGLAGFRKKFKK